jgi:ketosteroid isomerase-like protein
MRLTFIFLLVTCAWQAVCAQKTDAAVLEKLEYDWLAAEFKLDTASIAGMMDDSFISIGATAVMNKREELNEIYRNISQRIKNDHLVDSFYFEGVHIIFHGSTAIVTFIVVTRGRQKGIPYENRKTRFYDAWIKKHGQWKAISSQGTPVN